MPTSRVISSSLLWGTVLVSVSACNDSDLPVRPTTPISVVSLVTGEAAANLDGQGRFRLFDPLDLPYPQITETRARELADAFRVLHLPQIMRVMEKDRGVGVNESALRVCGRVYYAEPAVEPLPATVSPAARRAYGPFWLVPLCGASGLPEISVAVSAYATELKVDNGRIVYPVDGGEFFIPLGIPVGRPDGLPGYPETALASVVATGGIRVSKVPRLVTLPRTMPQLSYWKLELERTVNVRSVTGKVSETANIFFIDDARWGHRGSWIAKDGGPLEYQYVWAVPQQRYGERPAFVKGSVSVRPGMALQLEPLQENQQ